MSNLVAEPTTREEIESIIKAKIQAGEAETGLYDVGLSYVVVDDVIGEGIVFQWFDHMMPLSDLLID